jgi:transposase
MPVSGRGRPTLAAGCRRMRNAPEIVGVNQAHMEEVLRRIEQAEPLDEQDAKLIRTVCESYVYMTGLLGDKNTSLQRLRKLLFGAQTEKTVVVVGRNNQNSDLAAPKDPADIAIAASESDPSPSNESTTEPAAKGHGRNGADAYAGADQVDVLHPSLKPGDPCPACENGTVYDKTPGVVVRIIGQPPVAAKVYRLQKLRCHLCGKVFTAPAPDEAGGSKYDATAGAMIGLLKYGSGLPFNRLEGLQGHLEIPLPASTQWDIVAAIAENLAPAVAELIRQAAQGEVLHNDDTTVKILELMKQNRAQILAGTGEVANAEGEENQADQRTGLFTTGVVALRDGHRVALFFSGRQHAGENLANVLKQRAEELPPPIQMCDALSRNLPGELQTIVANCLAHARRNFVDVYDRFPEQCRHLLDALAVVYRNDAIARKKALLPEARLQLHQQESGPTMQQLHEWLTRQLDEKLAEPNAAIGGAIRYMLKHWEKLTLFLRQAGAPLDNNVCERALKKAILHRKNALFYKTRNGARVGDLFMSLIYTCQLNEANPFDYLTELQRHPEQLVSNPERWMPWNYRESLT